MQEYSIYVILSVIYLISVVIFQVCSIRCGDKAILITKSIASLLFVLIGCLTLSSFEWGGASGIVDVIRITSMFILIFIGLVHGCAGDILLALRRFYPKKKTIFIALGMAAFGLGHIYYTYTAYRYLISFADSWGVMNQIMIAAAPILLASIVIAIYFKLAPYLHLSFGKLKPAVTAYSYLISFLLLTTWIGCILAYVSGGDGRYLIPIVPVTLLVFSDALLSTNYFDKEQKSMSVKQNLAIHVTYYAAQYLIALGVFPGVMSSGIIQG
ncbi:MAG: lysoplasmalogenase [Proteobacteria bacterium]|nr:lysoplasmalogenase [Pseudomonadota bacterium]